MKFEFKFDDTRLFSWYTKNKIGPIEFFLRPDIDLSSVLLAVSV